MRLAVESCVQARALEARVLEQRRHLVRVGIDRRIAERRDEGVEVRRRLALLDRIGLRAGRILRRDESLRDRDGCAALSLSLPPHETSVTAVTATRIEMASRIARSYKLRVQGRQGERGGHQRGGTRIGSMPSRGDRDRTCDLWFWRPALCQLSYAPEWLES